MGKRTLPPISPRPTRAESHRWTRRYFEVGDRVKGVGLWGGLFKKFDGRITKITVNKYGRVSYWLRGHEVMLEEIVANGSIRRRWLLP